MTHDDNSSSNEGCGCERRDVLKAAVGLGVGLQAWPMAALAQDDAAKKAPPRKGDKLVYSTGDKKGQVVKLDDLPVGGPQKLAYPIDPATQTVRNGSRLNEVAVVRLDPAQLAEETRERSAEGVVAYSAMCTHQGCPVNMWKADKGTLFCSCHGTQYDPKEGGKVVEGPAPRRLAALPLTVENGEIVVAGEFQGRLGFKGTTN